MCASDPGARRRRPRGGSPAPGSGGVRVVDIVEQWSILEADFQRDYGIDLTEAVFEGGLGWRRFQALMTGLSFDSVWRAWLREKPRPPLSGKAAERYFDLI